MSDPMVAGKATAEKVAAEKVAPRGLRVTRRVSRRAGFGSAGAIFGGAVLVSLIFAALVLPLPYDPITPDPTSVLQAPSGEHWFGTDLSGFDVFSRTIAAARLDLPLALTGALVSMVIGVALGLLASGKGRAGERIMRALDAFQSFPLLVLAVAVVTLTGNSLGNVVLAIALINVPRFMRLVRSEVLSLRESRFVEAAIAIGATRWRLTTRHLLPNVSGVIIAQTSLAAADAVVVIAAMSFLGVGIVPPDPSWGSMIQIGARNMASGQWWAAVFPGLAVVLVVVSLNLIADRLEEYFDRAQSNA